MLKNVPSTYMKHEPVRHGVSCENFQKANKVKESDLSFDFLEFKNVHYFKSYINSNFLM